MFRRLFSTSISQLEFPIERIRNFSIIAHIDHGKSTLADRLMELTRTITPSATNKQVLDRLEVERSRGITVKAQTVSLVYRDEQNVPYLLNLIDTPGHVDFSYEVSRSLAACQGCILLVDSVAGIQAQTVAHFWLAFSAGLSVIPVLNKVEMADAEPDKVAEDLAVQFELKDPLRISAKTGFQVDQVLSSVIKRIPPPSGNPKGPTRVLLFDCWFDEYRGVICLVAVVDGSLTRGQRIQSVHGKQFYDIAELGVMHPDRVPSKSLSCGQVGYLILNMKTCKEAHIGDTFIVQGETNVKPLPGFEPAKPMVYAGFFPGEGARYPELEAALSKLLLNDASVTQQPEASPSLGLGWRLGFLGSLHMDVFRQRLEQEYNALLIATAPTVPYRVLYKNGEERWIQSPHEFPSVEAFHGHGPDAVLQVREPWISATMILPSEYLGAVIALCEDNRGQQISLEYLDTQNRVMLKYKLPLMEIITRFFDALKRATSGYASFDYEPCGDAPAQLSKLQVLLHGEAVNALCYVVHESRIQTTARRLVTRLKSIVERQLYPVAIQVVIGSRVVARDTLPAYRKDVLQKLHAADESRRQKLLQRQREGNMVKKQVGHVRFSHDAFLKLVQEEGEGGSDS